MKSPFPGMDPYMERRWNDIHNPLITYVRDSINDRLGDSPMRADIEQKLTVELHDDEEVDYGAEPDVTGLEDAKGGEPYLSPDEDGVATATRTMPIVVPTSPPQRRRWIDIVDLNNRRVVTTIELVSPTNKSAGRTRTQFLRKRRNMIAAGVNVVEIDLTRAGRRRLPVDLAGRPPFRDAIYLAWVWRGQPSPQFEVYPMPLREPLPTILIQLRVRDADLPLALQPLVETAHQRARFRPADYDGELHPPLPSDDAAWAAELVAPLLKT